MKKMHIMGNQGRSLPLLPEKAGNSALFGLSWYCRILIAFLYFIMPYIYAHARTIPYADIVNTAPVTYHSKGHEFTEYSNTVVTHIVKNETVIEFLYYAPFDSNAETVPVGTTEFSPSGNPNGPFVQLDPPKQKDGETPIDLSNGVPLAAAKRFYAGDPVFIRLQDPDQNSDSTKVDEAIITVSVGILGETEVLRLRETGPNTSVFTAYIQSKPTDNQGNATPGDGFINVLYESKIDISHTNIADGTNTTVEALVDPWGTVFDSKTGQPVNGVIITIIDVETGQPAEVFGDDGISSYPSSIETGSRFADGSGKVYASSDGSYRFPHVKPGNYRLEVEMQKQKYTFPSKISGDILQYLPNAPFNIINGSRGEDFEVKNGPPFLIDIPLDPYAHEDPGMQNPLWVVKTSGKLNVSPGDFLAYTLNITNRSAVKVDSIVVTDHLPAKFRYQKDSAKMENGTKIEPIISSDGRTLTFFLGDILTNGTVKFTYVIKAASGAKPGKVVNSAFATAAGGYGSNIAKAEVQIVDDLFRSNGIIVGSVIADSCAVSDTTQTNGMLGVRGVRIYLEDGTYTVTDEKGMFHFEGVRPGVHILQLDLDSLPEQYEVIPCEQGNRFAGRRYSQFVDLQGGTLWRSDFRVMLKPRMKGEARLTIRSAISDKLKVAEEEFDVMPDYNNAWLASATPGFEIIWPSPDYSPPISSLKLAVKHDPKHVITVTIDGKLIEPLNFENTDKNEAGSVAVSRWIGIDIHEGDNQFDVVAADSTGKEINRIVRKIHYSGPPVHIELINDKSILVADGRTTPRIAIRMTDKDGYPVRNGITGSFTLDKPYITMQEMDKLRSSALNGSGTGNNYVIGKGGLAIIELQPTTRSGEAVLRFQFNEIKDEIRAWLKPEARDWVLVGLAEDTMGFNTISGNVENLDDSDIREDYYENGRVAFFAKGKVKGSWLMTLSYDTARKKSSTGEDLSGTIDPDKYYTLYGDAAEQDYDAATTRKLYLKIERSQFYALFGVYNTGLTFTELSRYNRTFNGLKSEINNEHYSVNMFANETGQSFVKDEIRGDGTSGLYRLTRKKILVNSEKITIETRDRFRSEVIISSKNLTRHLDYNIDYDACTIFFKEPIMSKDESLNPIFIVIDYETGETSGDSFNYGGRGAIKFDNRKIEIGSTYLHESVDGNTGNLIGTDATVRIGTTLEFKGELAHSNSDINGDGKKGSAYIAEMTRRSGKLDGKMYIRELKGNFGLGQQSTGEIGTRKLGFDSSYRFSQMFTINQQLYRQYNLDKDGVRDLAEAKLNYTGDRYFTSLGFRHAEDRITDETNRSEQISLGGGVRMLNKKLQLRMTHDQTVSGNNANADFPTRTTAGVDYDILKSATLFAEQEFTSGKKEDSHGTRVGVKTRPWNGAQFDTSVENKYSENNNRLFANLGLRQSLFLTKKLSADLGLDRSQSFKHPGNKPFNENVPLSSGIDNNFTSLSLGTNYHEEKWSWTNRLETRFSDSDDKWGIMSGVYGELRKGLGLSGSAQILNTSAAVGDKQNSGDIRFGFAYRPENSKWIVLNRLDFVQENNTTKKTEISGSKIVNNMNANFEFSLKTQFSFQYVAKYVLDTINGDEYSGYLDIFGIEMRKYLTNRFDVGVRGSALHSWDVSQYEYSSGISLGFNIMHNIWLSAGYNFTGFEDRDYSSGNYTSQGPFLQFRSKFDQDTIKDALTIFGGIPKTESTSDKAAIRKK